MTAPKLKITLAILLNKHPEKMEAYPSLNKEYIDVSKAQLHQNIAKPKNYEGNPNFKGFISFFNDFETFRLKNTEYLDVVYFDFYAQLHKYENEDATLIQMMEKQCHSFVNQNGYKSKNIKGEGQRVVSLSPFIKRKLTSMRKSPSDYLVYV